MGRDVEVVKVGVGEEAYYQAEVKGNPIITVKSKPPLANVVLAVKKAITEQMTK